MADDARAYRAFSIAAASLIAAAPFGEFYFADRRNSGGPSRRYMAPHSINTLA